MPKFIALATVFALLFIQHVHPLLAQVSGATLSGVVHDEAETPVSNATVVVKNVATGVSRELTTKADGSYAAPNLLPGIYHVTASAPNFSTAVEDGISLAVGSTGLLNLTLRKGEVNETFVIKQSAPTVDLSTSAITGNVDPITVRDLPLNGRDWTQLAILEPMVDTVP
ncbi:MAG: carboxypeptidase regulatory-like domain-containing protein, partial [Acidobacteria bacterium]|nr:carboxypeptidase regulatory-like domain-containing protein [Acidobacteriota bacterium]